MQIVVRNWDEEGEEPAARCFGEDVLIAQASESVHATWLSRRSRSSRGCIWIENEDGGLFNRFPLVTLAVDDSATNLVTHGSSAVDDAQDNVRERSFERKEYVLSQFPLMKLLYYNRIWEVHVTTRLDCVIATTAASAFVYSLCLSSSASSHSHAAKCCFHLPLSASSSSIARSFARATDFASVLLLNVQRCSAHIANL